MKIPVTVELMKEITALRTENERLQHVCRKWSADYAKLADELVAVKAKLADVVAERNCLLVTGCSTNPFRVAEAFERLNLAKVAAERRADSLLDMLREVSSSGISWTSQGAYHEVQIGTETWERLKAMCDRSYSKEDTTDGPTSTKATKAANDSDQWQAASG